MDIRTEGRQRNQTDLFEQVEESLPPLEQVGQVLPVLSLRVQHVVKELSPQLRGERVQGIRLRGIAHLDLPPPLEVVLDNPLVLDGADLDVLAEEEAVGRAGDAKVVQVVFALATLRTCLWFGCLVDGLTIM